MEYLKQRLQSWLLLDAQMQLGREVLALTRKRE